MVKTKNYSIEHDKKVVGYVFMLPAMALLIGLILYPLIYGIHKSFFKWNWVAGMDKMNFIWLGNYLRLLKDEFFWNSLVNTLYFTGLALFIEFPLGLVSALLLNSRIKGQGVFRTIFMFPLMVSDIVAALTWKMLLDPSRGIVNAFLSSLGIGAVNWLGNTSVVILTLVLADTWWQTGIIILILLAGLQSLSNETVEAARIDGANNFQFFRYLTWPHLIPYIKIALTFRIIDLLRVFALSWGITQGGPVRSSEVTQLYIYTQGMGKYLDIGYSTALALTFAVILSVIVFAFNKFCWRGK